MSNDIVARLRCYADINDAVFHPWVYAEAADKIERLRGALRDVREVYAGSEGIPEPMTAAEGYLLWLLMEMTGIASSALEGEASDDAAT